MCPEAHIKGKNTILIIGNDLGCPESEPFIIPSEITGKKRSPFKKHYDGQYKVQECVLLLI